MSKKYILQRSIDIWTSIHNFYNRRVIKKIASILLRIDSQIITDLSVMHRCINVFTKRYLYKIQLSGDRIERDLNNRKLFTPCAESLVSPVIVHRKKPLIIKLPILDEPKEYDKYAYYVLAELAKCGHMEKFEINKYPLIIAGLNILESFECGKQVRRKVYQYLQKREDSIVRVGLVHGDFHRGNIMIMDGKPVLIDFDCARDNDIQAIDALYYILEEVRYKHGQNKSWLEYWRDIFNNINSLENYICFEQVDIDLKFGFVLLLLDRLAQDFQYDYSFKTSYRDSINRINRLILKEK